MSNINTISLLQSLLPLHPRFDKTFILTANHFARLLRLYKRQAEEPTEVAPDDLMIIKESENFLLWRSV